jgi:hypothetical protein
MKNWEQSLSMSSFTSSAQFMVKSSLMAKLALRPELVLGGLQLVIKYLQKRLWRFYGCPYARREEQPVLLVAGKASSRKLEII